MALSFSPQAVQHIAALRTRYPTTQAICMPVLHLAQETFGHLSDEVLTLVANTLALPPAHVYGVATFYTMYHREPVGKHVLMMCTNVSCMLKGGMQTLQAFEQTLGIRAGETTADGAFTLIEEECLAACADAPALVVGERYFLRATPDQVPAILQQCRQSAGPTGGSHAR